MVLWKRKSKSYRLDIIFSDEMLSEGRNKNGKCAFIDRLNGRKDTKLKGLERR